MDEPSLNLKISGPLLSKLFHQSYCDEGYCGGVLLGETATTTRNEITDSDHTMSEHETICVQDYMPMSRKEFFSMKNTESDNKLISRCVGFYKIRKSTNTLSVLEKEISPVTRKCSFCMSMHKGLAKKLTSSGISSSKCKIATLLITFEENGDNACLSWKIRAYTRKPTGHYSTLRVKITNLQGSVFGSYITHPSPPGDVLSVGANTILESFQSAISSGPGKISLVESTREVTGDLVTELESAVDELGRHERLLGDRCLEKSLLLRQIESLTAQIDEIRTKRTSEIRGVRGHRAGQVREQDAEVAPAALPMSEENYQKAKRRSLHEMKLRSSAVAKEKSEVSQGAISSSDSISSSAGPERRRASAAGMGDLIKLDDSP